MSYRIIDKAIGTLITTTITPSIVLSYTLPSDCSAIIDAVIIARNTTTGDCTGSRKIFTAKNVAGAASVFASGTNLFSNQGDISLVATTNTVNSLGANIQVQVTGLALTTIEWMAALTIYIN